MSSREVVEEWAVKHVGLEAARRMLDGELDNAQIRRMSKAECLAWLMENDFETLETSYLIELRVLGSD